MIALPILLVVILGAIQFGLIYEAKATLNHASLQAARAGAVSNAEPGAIRRGLARGLAPLYSPPSSLQGVASTVVRINSELLADARVRILNPTREAFVDFGEEVDGIREIPNDRLHTRSTAIGARSGLNIQDANILKVEITYGYELKVPLVNWFISRVLLGARDGGAMDAFERQLLRRALLPIVATSTVRMQSPARMSDEVVARGDLPDVDRIPADASPPPASQHEGDGDKEEGNDGESNDSDAGSSLADGFLGYGGGPADGSGGGSTSGNAGGGSGAGNEGGGGNSGDPQMCPVDDGDSGSAGASGASVPAVMLPSLSVGNPIHVVTGNKYQMESDLVPLPGVLGIAFARHYNSEAADHAGAVGAGWRHGYEASIRISADGASIDLWQADGRHLAFNRSTDSNTYVARRAGDGEIRVEQHGYRWLWPAGRELRFDLAGRLTGMREGARHLTLQYNDAQQLIRIIDPQQRVLRIEYYSNGRVSRVQSVAGAAWRYVYDEAGNLAQVTSADGSTRRYEYQDARHPHHLTEISGAKLQLDDYGNRTSFERIATWAYDAQGRAVLSSHPDDAGKVTLEYGDGYTDVTDAFGRVSRYVTARRNGVALVTEVRGPGCSSCGQGDAGYRYNSHFQLIEVAARNAPTLRYQYDGRQRLRQVAREMSGAANEWLVRYHYAGNTVNPSRIERPSVKPGAVSAIEIAYRSDGEPLSIRHSGYTPSHDGFLPIERGAKFAYDPTGNLRSIDGPRTDARDVSLFMYDAYGRVSAARTADGLEQRISEYDAAGRPTHIDRVGRPAIRIAYDVAGRVTKVTELRAAAERSIRYSYDYLGRLQGIEQAEGRSQRIAYDLAGRPNRFIAGGSGTETALVYVPDGNISSAAVLSRNGLMRVLHYAYDAERRLKEVRDGDGPPLRQFVYAGDDARPGRIIDPLGFETAFNYDATGNIDSIIAADGGVTRFERDALGHPTDVSAPNDAHTSYTYDDFGRRVSEDSADRGVTQYGYDAAGNLVLKTDARGEKARFVYDAMNRLISVIRQDGTTRLHYEKGHLVKISGSSSEERFSYTADGQLATHTRIIAGRTFTTSYRYDRNGRGEVRMLPSGQRLHYQYAQNGSLRAIMQKSLLKDRLLVGSPEDDVSNLGNASTAQMDPLGHLAYGNGLTAKNTYAVQTGYIDRRTIRNVNTFEYDRDASGRIAGIKDGHAAQSYNYDSIGRLTAARTALGDFSYGYDLNGNRLFAIASTGSNVSASFASRTRSKKTLTERYVYTANSNRLLTIEGAGKTAYQYDAAGNSTHIGNRRYEYDSAGRLMRLHIDGRLTAEYRYNLSGERISKTSFIGKNPQTTLYIYEWHQLIAEADEHGNVTREYLYLGQHPVAMLDHGTAYWIHTDHLGTPIAITDKNQRIVWSAQYEPFGKAIVEEDPDGDGKRLSLNLRFPGQYADAESGTNYNIMRDYDPQSGRYATSDPIGLQGGENSFAYAGGNPVNAIDPLGLYLFAFDGTWIDASLEQISNVTLFQRYYEGAGGDAFYRSGVGSAVENRNEFVNFADKIIGGLSGFGASARIDSALDVLRTLVADESWDGIIDLVGFSRGATTARAFANEVFARIDRGEFVRCTPIRIRFMGLFDSVGSFGVPGNDVDSGYDFRIDARVGYAAQAIAMDEHRWAFDLSSIEANEHQAGSQSNRIEQGFIGAHSDIGGAYTDGDLSDIALQWMHQQASLAGVELGALASEHMELTRPLIHDERLLKWFPDREIFYPNDPNWRPATCNPPPGPRSDPASCAGWTPPSTQRQSSAPQFPDLSRFIVEDPGRNAVRGSVDIGGYLEWLKTNGVLPSAQP